MLRARNKLVLVILLAVAVSCTSNPGDSDDDLLLRVILCNAPRPELCTREYRPVCGLHRSEIEWKTYSNACSACSDSAVRGYRPEACDH